ncbi:hypothetical protein BSPWISOXPB_7289 [uncultured Gammaproteobacteria bacterium]|nr:hypothetical protein BSPWISOXPB_7289 [uncultured Gammaproteobacteria bacterium]
MTTTTSGSSPKVTYFDAFNRKTKEQHTGFDGRKIISDIHYDDLGRVKQASCHTLKTNKGILLPQSMMLLVDLSVPLSR